MIYPTNFNFPPVCRYPPISPDIPRYPLISPNIPDSGALSVLNLARNNLGELVLPKGWTDNRRTGYQSGAQFTHADGRKQPAHPGKPEGVIALANAIPDMGALTKLDISRNYIAATQGEDLQRICAASGIELAK